MPAATSQAGVPRQSFFAADARADGLQRKVTIEGGQVRIARRYKGMAMQIGVPLRLYRGVLLSLEPSLRGGGIYRVSLLHADPDLSIVLEEVSATGPAPEIWHVWSRELDLPRLVEREAGEVELFDAPALHKRPVARRCRPLRSRRGRFAMRRKPGIKARMDLSFSGEREIVARN